MFEGAFREPGEAPGLPTATMEEQEEVEARVVGCFEEGVASSAGEGGWPSLDREAHVRYLWGCLDGSGPPQYQGLEASGPWIAYWAVHGLALLDALPGDAGGPRGAAGSAACTGVLEALAARVAGLQNADGGFGGAEGHASHAAPTYAAVCCLSELGRLDLLDATALRRFLGAVKLSPGSRGFCVHALGGENDVRACYTALAAARVAGVLDAGLAEGVPEYCRTLQTYEGGTGGEEGNEAHGGYAFCGLAACMLACEALGARTGDFLDLPQMLRWASRRQMRFEGGFQGRTGKLVDGCYSFWVGGLFPLLQAQVGSLVAEGSGWLPSPDVGEGRRPRATGDARRATLREIDDDDDVAAAAAAASSSWSSSRLEGGGVDGGGEREESDGGASTASNGWTPVAEVGEAADLFGGYALRTREVVPAVAAGDERRRTAPLFDPRALQGYLLGACQDEAGGLRDKPGKARDLYHTCYCLSGLSAAQHWDGGRDEDGNGEDAGEVSGRSDPWLLGGPGARLRACDPLVNVRRDRLH